MSNWINIITIAAASETCETPVVLRRHQQKDQRQMAFGSGNSQWQIANILLNLQFRQMEDVCQLLHRELSSAVLIIIKCPQKSSCGESHNQDRILFCIISYPN